MLGSHRKLAQAEEDRAEKAGKEGTGAQNGHFGLTQDKEANLSHSRSPCPAEHGGLG